MAEPQRASSLPALVTRPRRVRRRLTSDALSRLDATEDLSPPTRTRQPAEPQPALEPESTWSTWARRSGRVWRFAFPARSPGEWALMAVLLLGLALNAGALLSNAALSRSDRLLGSAVFLAGLVLLVLIEIGRHRGTNSR